MSERPGRSDLAASLFETLVSLGSARSYQPGEQLFRQGEVADQVYLIESGLVKITRTAPDGHVSLLALRGPNTMTGEYGSLVSARRSAGAVAVRPTTASVVPAERFVDLCSRSCELAFALLRNLTQEMIDASGHILAFTSADSMSRLANRLVQLIDDPGLGARITDRSGRAVIEMPISQSELAEWAGLSRRGAVKALHGLRQAGIVETGRKQIVICDVDRLRSAASGMPDDEHGVRL